MIDKMKFKDCSKCGICKSICPVYKLFLKEKHSPRGKIILLEQDMLDGAFFLCTTCGACKEVCPVGSEIPVISVRKAICEEGRQTKANKEMLEKIKKYGNPFGENDGC
jgi:fumarate reductase (CoM/CoB) subunit B